MAPLSGFVSSTDISKLRAIPRSVFARILLSDTSKDTYRLAATFAEVEREISRETARENFSRDTGREMADNNIHSSFFQCNFLFSEFSRNYQFHRTWRLRRFSLSCSSSNDRVPNRGSITGMEKEINLHSRFNRVGLEVSRVFFFFFFFSFPSVNPWEIVAR